MPENISPTLADLVVPIGEIHPRKQNPRRGSIEKIAESLTTNGQYRPLVVNQRTAEVLAGNHTLKAALSLGWDEIAVTYVDVDEEQAARIVLIDNRASDLAEYDDQELVAILGELGDDLSGTGYTKDDLAEILKGIEGEEDDAKENPYTTDINVPQYELKGEEPNLNELYDDRKTNKLRKAIDASGAPDNVKEFLSKAAERHTVFDYRKIAEYYPHATPEVQQLIEDSALVILDYDDAKKQGYIKLSEKLAAQQQEDADGV